MLFMLIVIKPARCGQGFRILRLEKAVENIRTKNNVIKNNLIEE